MFVIYYREQYLGMKEFGEEEFRFFSSRPTPYEISDEHGLPFYGISFTDPFWFKLPQDPITWEDVNPYACNEIPRRTDFIYMPSPGYGVLQVVPQPNGDSQFTLIPQPFSEFTELYSLENYLKLPFRDLGCADELLRDYGTQLSSIYIMLDPTSHKVLQLQNMEVLS